MTGIDVRYARWDGVGRPFSVVSTTASTDLPPGRALVAVDLATICGSDLHTVLGHRDSPAPGILGHEQVGRVVAVSSEHPPSCFDGSLLQVGDRVVWSLTASCGNCRNCARGLEQKCLHLRKYGHERVEDDWLLSGGFATHVTLLAGTTIVRVPGAVPDVVAGPASCATATVAAVLDAAPVLPGRRLLIAGAGMLGVTAAAMAAEAGAEVIVSDPDRERRLLAEEFGAAEVVGSDQTVTDVDVFVELSGDPDAVTAGLASLAVGGHAVLAGSVSTSRPIEVDPERVVRNLLTITGVHNYRPQHLAVAVAFLAAHQTRYPFTELIGDRFTLDRLDDAILAANGTAALRQAIVPGGVASSAA